MNDLQLARALQQSLIPERVIDDGIDVAVRCEPAQWVGGDCATVFRRAAREYFVCVSDVTGHGVAAALVSGRVNTFVLDHVAQAVEPCGVVDPLNRFLCRHLEGLGMFVSFFCALVDLNRMRIAYVGCGHPPALLLPRGARRPVRLEPRHTLLGIFPETTNACTVDRVSIESGDRLVVVTDGVVEARNAAREPFGLERVEAILSDAGHDSSDRIVRRVLRAVESHRGESASDDVLAMAVAVQ